jgi:hypothetical protein
MLSLQQRGVLSLRAADTARQETNPIQREFDSNGGIAPFDTLLASSHPRQKTNLFKQFVLFCSLSLRSGGGVLSLRAAERGVL